MQINNKQRKTLKGLAHHLSPVLYVGKSALSEALLKEADANLEHHQLIKVKISCDDKLGFREISEDLAQATKSTLVQAMGRTAVYYRKPRLASTKVKIALS